MGRSTGLETNMKTNHPSVAIGGVEALLAQEVAAELYQHGGRHLLSPAGKAALRKGAHEGARTALARSMGQGLRQAGTQAAMQAGRAASLGGLFDGGVAAVEAAVAYHRGELESRDALRHVARETTTGAAAAFAGAVVATALVAVTGPMAGPAVLVVGAGTAATTKSALSVMGRDA
jgi:hypothetical protein